MLVLPGLLFLQAVIAQDTISKGTIDGSEMPIKVVDDHLAI